MTPTITAFKWVPVFARGFVRDIRARWASLCVLEIRGSGDADPSAVAASGALLLRIG